MQIILNGKRQEWPEHISLKEVVASAIEDSQSCAVAINGVFVPRSQYVHTTLAENDVVEVVIPMQGG